MINIIVAFPKKEDAKNIKNLLVRNGYNNTIVCTNGLQVINSANELDGGIVVCGYKLQDLHFLELHEYLPQNFEMLLVASKSKWDDCIDTNIVCLDMPIKVHDLLNTLEMMIGSYTRHKKKDKKPKQRTDKEKAIIEQAKSILMTRNNMSEQEAHRYIQKTSMDSGTNMIETAEMIISLM